MGQHQQQQLETVGEKLGQLQKSLLAKQSYLAKVIQVQKRMLVEQRAVIERLSCKLGKDHEDVELQFSAAVAKVPYVEGHDLVVENEAESTIPDDEKFLSLQRRAMLLPESSITEEEEEDDEDFYEEVDHDDDDNDSFITINTSEDSGSDETVENSESNDSGVIEPEFRKNKQEKFLNKSKTQEKFLRQNKVSEKSYEMAQSPPQRSYGINPIFAAHFNNSHFDQDSLDSNAVAAGSEFKYVKNTKWKTSKAKKLQKTRNFHPKKSQSTGVVIENEISKEIGKSSVLRENETFAYNESCLI